MKKFIFLILLSIPLAGYCQQKDLTDSTEFRYGLPVSNDDTTQRVLTDEDPSNRWEPVEAAKIPKRLRETLQDKEVYDGWEQGQIYFDKSVKQYLVRIREAKAVRTYSFSEEGAVVSFAEEDVIPRDSIK
jgi:hypothetical protein